MHGEEAGLEERNAEGERERERERTSAWAKVDEEGW